MHEMIEGNYHNDTMKAKPYENCFKKAHGFSRGMN